MIDVPMTPNEYRMLARRIRETSRAMRKEPGCGVIIADLLSRLVRYYHTTDPAFDAVKFLVHAGERPETFLPLLDEESDEGGDRA